MITATLTRFYRENGEWKISILYTNTDTGGTFENNYSRVSVTKKQLRDLARREAAAIDLGEVSDVDLPIGTTIDVTPDPVDPPAPPTQAEIDEAAWLDDWNRLQAMIKVTEAVPALATAQANTAIANLRATLEAGWQNSYLGNIS